MATDLKITNKIKESAKKIIINITNTVYIIRRDGFGVWCRACVLQLALGQR